jgi:hypothetical protein
MKILLAGPIDGKIEQFYQGKHADWVLSTGSVGIWPDPARIDQGTRKHAGPGDFALLYAKNEEMPIPTVFIEGPHDDHNWLQNRKISGQLEILPNLNYLVNGNKTLIGDILTQISIVGLGKVFSYATMKNIKTKKAIRHYTKKDIEKAKSHGKTDILLLHEEPKCLEVLDLIDTLRPKLVLHSGEAEPYTFRGVTVLPLNAGSAIMLEIDNDKFNLSLNP